jgi:hypothetical protein
VETHDKVPRQNMMIIETRPKTSGHITDVKLQSKPDVDSRVTTSVKTDSTTPTAFDATVTATMMQINLLHTTAQKTKKELHMYMIVSLASHLPRF